ncbi:MAG: 3-dehydroquinate dehydratase [Bacteroidia bacterium]
MSILIINGPNLNLLGKREPEKYGHLSFEEVLKDLRITYDTIEIEYYQSNVEGELIDRIHKAVEDEHSGIILNAGGYSHTSVALADAVAAIDIPVVSVHISNIYQREEERHKELLTKHVVGGIYGLGTRAYKLAVQYLLSDA